MRITEARIANDFLYNVNNTQERINEYQNQLSSGTRVNEPSDDPEAADMIMRLNATLGRNEQFSSNVGAGQSMLSNSADALDGIGQIVAQLQTTMTQVSNGAQSSAIPTFADTVDGYLTQALALANTEFNGKYVFGGTQTQTPPYVLTPNAAPPPSQTVTYAGNDGKIEYAVGEGQTQPVNVTGQEAFNGTALFDQIIKIRDNLKAGITPTQADFTAVQASLQTLLNTSGRAGAILQSLDTTAAHLQGQHTQLLALRSVQQDTDVASATLNLKQEQTALDAALAVGAKILPQSLVNFLA
ncbi:MAG TPA: flagellar hook-associated protein FlgL [Bacteroidota bacterium]|nr:flagellar hook-associated protein FlgL [Bacteroidota bacterium]